MKHQTEGGPQGMKMEIPGQGGNEHEPGADADDGSLRSDGDAGDRVGRWGKARACCRKCTDKVLHPQRAWAAATKDGEMRHSYVAPVGAGDAHGLLGGARMIKPDFRRWRSLPSPGSSLCRGGGCCIRCVCECLANIDQPRTASHVTCHDPEVDHRCCAPPRSGEKRCRRLRKVCGCRCTFCEMCARVCPCCERYPAIISLHLNRNRSNLLAYLLILYFMCSVIFLTLGMSGVEQCRSRLSLDPQNSIMNLTTISSEELRSLNEVDVPSLCKYSYSSPVAPKLIYTDKLPWKIRAAYSLMTGFVSQLATNALSSVYAEYNPPLVGLNGAPRSATAKLMFDLSVWILTGLVIFGAVSYRNRWLGWGLPLWVIGFASFYVSIAQQLGDVDCCRFAAHCGNSACHAAFDLNADIPEKISVWKGIVLSPAFGSGNSSGVFLCPGPSESVPAGDVFLSGMTLTSRQTMPSEGGSSAWYAWLRGLTNTKIGLRNAVEIVQGSCDEGARTYEAREIRSFGTFMYLLTIVNFLLFISILLDGMFMALCRKPGLHDLTKILCKKSGRVFRECSRAVRRRTCRGGGKLRNSGARPRMFSIFFCPPPNVVLGILVACAVIADRASQLFSVLRKILWFCTRFQHFLVALPDRVLAFDAQLRNGTHQMPPLPANVTIHNTTVPTSYLQRPYDNLLNIVQKFVLNAFAGQGDKLFAPGADPTARIVIKILGYLVTYFLIVIFAAWILVVLLFVVRMAILWWKVANAAAVLRRRRVDNEGRVYSPEDVQPDYYYLRFAPRFIAYCMWTNLLAFWIQFVFIVIALMVPVLVVGGIAVYIIFSNAGTLPGGALDLRPGIRQLRTFALSVVIPYILVVSFLFLQMYCSQSYSYSKRFGILHPNLEGWVAFSLLIYSLLVGWAQAIKRVLFSLVGTVLHAGRLDMQLTSFLGDVCHASYLGVLDAQRFFYDFEAECEEAFQQLQSGDECRQIDEVTSVEDEKANRCAGVEMAVANDREPRQRRLAKIREKQNAGEFIVVS